MKPSTSGGAPSPLKSLTIVTAAAPAALVARAHRRSTRSRRLSSSGDTKTVLRTRWLGPCFPRSSSESEEATTLCACLVCPRGRPRPRPRPRTSLAFLEDELEGEAERAGPGGAGEPDGRLDDDGVPESSLELGGRGAPSVLRVPSKSTGIAFDHARPPVSSSSSCGCSRTYAALISAYARARSTVASSWSICQSSTPTSTDPPAVAARASRFAAWRASHRATSGARSALSLAWSHVVFVPSGRRQFPPHLTCGRRPNRVRISATFKNQRTQMGPPDHRAKRRSGPDACG